MSVKTSPQTRSQKLIDQLREVYTGNRFHFDFEVAMRISGDRNKELRREIVQELTGETRPLSKCGMYAVSDLLKNNFDQLKLEFVK